MPDAGPATLPCGPASTFKLLKKQYSNYVGFHLIYKKCVIFVGESPHECQRATHYKILTHMNRPAKEHTDDYFKNRRTIRRYTDAPVSPALINEMIEKACHAPTTGNMQLYSIVITRDTEEKQRLAPLHFGQPQVESAAVVLTFCADFHRMSRWCEERSAEPCYDNMQSFVAAAIDTIAVAQQFNTLAEQAGLGVCWLGTTTYNAPQIAEALQLPDLVVPMITLTVGYPAEEGADVGRLPVEAVIHHGKYQDYTPQRINTLFAEKEARDDSKRFVEENGKDTLAQVFTDVRYPRSNNEHFSVVFNDFLKKARFNN